MQDKINSFLLSPGPAYLIFILGVTNHWLTLLAYKIKGACPCTYTCGCGQVKLIFMDSNNVTSLSYSDEGIQEHIMEQEKKRISLKGIGYEKWRKIVMYQSYTDQKDIVNKIAHYVSGRTNLREEFVNEYVSKLLNCFSSHVDEALSINGVDMFIPLLVSWLDTHYPAKILWENLLPFLTNASILASNCLSPLSGWAQDNLTLINSIDTCSGLPQVDSFVLLLTTIVETLL